MKTRLKLCLLVSLLGCFVLSSCASLSAERLKQTNAYVVGRTVADLRQQLPPSRVDSLRPPGGWASSQVEGAEFALEFEKRTGQPVARCITWSSLGGILSDGFYYDYVFFDANDRLLGYTTRKVE